MDRIADSELVPMLGGTSFRKTPEEGRALPMLIARHSIHNIQPDPDLLK